MPSMTERQQQAEKLIALKRQKLAEIRAIDLALRALDPKNR